MKDWTAVQSFEVFKILYKEGARFMIVGHGIDLQDIKAIERAREKHQGFPKKVLTAKEFERYQDLQGRRQLEYLAGRWAVKEAFSKALGIGIGRGIDFNDIEISNDKLGKPFIKILNNKEAKIKEILNCQEFNIHLTISDEKSISGAVVIIEKVL